MFDNSAYLPYKSKDMQEKLKRLEEEFRKDLGSVADSKDIEALRIKYLGRKSELTQLFTQIPALPVQERGSWGQRLNSFKAKVGSSLDDRLKGSGSSEESLDLTFPSAAYDAGGQHILSIVNQQICSIFEKMGFIVAEGAEIEDEWHNFEALNIPLDHPSRDAFDTFYLNMPSGEGGKHLLRSHTSPSQIRLMQKLKPPLAIISPGRVYRPDEVDATHSFMFHQIEGFVVDETINFAHLKGVLLYFIRELFSSGANLRFRPHFFPFTEPSAEVDVSCIICEPQGMSHKPQTRKEIKGEAMRKCSVCKGKGWLEILGCGMIHPKVFSSCGINSRKYRGFAFGMGVERIAMLKYGIHDIRLFCENDVRFLRQFQS